MSPRLLIAALPLLLAACDLSDIPGMGPDPRVAQREADSKAIGGACRYGLRSIEDCYTLNPKAVKAHVFTGWKDMDQYMRENKIDGVAASAKPPAEDEASDAKAGDKAAAAKGDKGEKADAKADPRGEAKTVAKADTKAEPKAKPAAAAHH